MRNIDWVLLRARLKEALLVLPHFFKNPVQGMRTLPDWDWPTMLILQGGFAAICDLIGSLIERSNWLAAIAGVILAPISSLALLAIGAGIFYYTFMFFFRREIPYRQIYLVLIFAAIPVHLTTTVIALVPPVILIGVAAFLYLCFVAFTDNFSLERDKTKKLLIGLGLVYALFWATQLVNHTTRHDRMRLKATPESLDILEKELKLED